MTSLVSYCARIVNQNKWPTLLHDRADVTTRYTFFFNVDAVVCQNNGQFQVWKLNIWQFIVIVEIKYFFNLNEYYLPIFILSIHFRQISFFFLNYQRHSE
jgi:hypothetical protein